VGGIIVVAGRKGGEGREKLTEWGEEEGLDGEERRVDFGGQPQVGSWAGEASGGVWMNRENIWEPCMDQHMLEIGRRNWVGFGKRQTEKRRVHVKSQEGKRGKVRRWGSQKGYGPAGRGGGRNHHQEWQEIGQEGLGEC
jgi:hypothetical protein